MKRLVVIGAALMLAAALSACGGSSGTAGSSITVSDAWVRNPPISDQPGAAYLVVQNNGAADKLLSVTSDIARTIELHESMESGGMMQMSPVPNIPIPANSKVELKPGGLHLMLINLTRPLQTGDKVQLTLNFEKAGKIPATAEVKEQ
jgi:periplasmic copper chaperone A